MYEKIYYFEALEKITEGKKTYCCDKQDKNVFCVNYIPVDDYVLLLDKCKKDSTRYEFWTEKEGAE